MNLTPEDSCKTPRAVKAKKGWRNTSLSLCLSRGWPYMTGATRLYMFSTRGWHKSVKMCVWWSPGCVRDACACVWASFTSPSFTATQLHQHSPRKTHSWQRLCQRSKEMECVYVRAPDKKGRRWTPEKPEQEKKRRKETGGEIDTRGGWGVRCERKSSETSGKEKESLGRGGNYSCPTMIHWGKFSSASPSPPFCPPTSLPSPVISLCTAPCSLWLIAK